MTITGRIPLPFRCVGFCFKLPAAFFDSCHAFLMLLPGTFKLGVGFGSRAFPALFLPLPFGLFLAPFCLATCLLFLIGQRRGSILRGVPRGFPG